MTSTLIKRIALPVAMLVVVAAAVVASTGAFFSDTETSTGNTFTAGAIDLKIDSQTHYDGMICTNIGTTQQPNYVWQAESQGSSTYPELLGQPCTGTWTLRDLTVEKLFSFLDLKPGDNGENTISLHVENNEAWACMAFTNLTEADNGQTEPEQIPDIDDNASGELTEAMMFFAWHDDGDNVYESGETPITPSPTPTASFINSQTIALADSTTVGGPILPTQTKYVGVAWCMGAMTVVGNTISCSGAGVGNESQTDSMGFDVKFDVVQSRNNLNYRCDGVYCTPVNENLFSNGFENGFSGWSQNDNDWHTTNTSAHSGTYAAFAADQGSNDDVLRKAVSTAGHNNIVFSYWYKIAASFESSEDEHVYAEWFDGTTWHVLVDYTNVPAGNWTQASFSLPSGAANNPNFQIRFRAQNLEAIASDKFMVDDVLVKGDTICPL